VEGSIGRRLRRRHVRCVSTRIPRRHHLSTQACIGHMKRIVIVDKYDVVRAGLRNVLTADPDWDVVAEAADGRQALRELARQRPDVLITDYSVPLLNGVEITRQATQRFPETKVLVFTQHDSEPVIGEALRAGALGFVLKGECNGTLVQAVRSLCEGRPYFSTVVGQLLLRSFCAMDCAVDRQVLTPREKSVVQLVAEGHSNKKIAEILCVSPKTIETHRFQANQKLNLKSTAALVRYAIRNSLAEA
jgi:DNA-binding NarL/FixJ family response regulator